LQAAREQIVRGLVDADVRLDAAEQHLTDCIAARAEQNRQLGLRKMELAGALPSSVETALFELMRDAGHEQFKAVQKLIK
jgi:hypothetical protein